jgi:hypothetical protein
LILFKAIMQAPSAAEVLEPTTVYDRNHFPNWKLFFVCWHEVNSGDV